MLQNSKAIINEGSNEERESALQTLYSTLEVALLFSHPFLPFITEELWQRLPRRPGDETPSITVASYPTYDETLHNPEAEAAYQLVLDCSAAIRSLKAEFESKDEAQSKHLRTPLVNCVSATLTMGVFPVFIQTFDSASHKTASEQVQAVKSLSGKGATSITILDSAAARSQGCVAFPVSSRAAVFLHVRGRVDMEAELAKAATKLSRAETAVAKWRKTITDPVYREKVAAATQEEDRKKLADLESEARHLEGTIEQFEALRLEA